MAFVSWLPRRRWKCYLFI